MDPVCAAFIKVERSNKFAVLVRTTEPPVLSFHKYRCNSTCLIRGAKAPKNRPHSEIKQHVSFLLHNICILCESIHDKNNSSEKYIDVRIRAVTIWDFHYMITVTKRMHDNNIIVISIENLKIKIPMLSVKFIFDFVHCAFRLVFLQMNYTQNKSVGRWTENLLSYL